MPSPHQDDLPDPTNAAVEDKAELIKLIKNGSNNAVINNYIATANMANSQVLYVVAVHGSVDLIRALVKRGANVNAQRPSDQCTALHLASRAGRIDIVECLLQCEDIDITLTNREGLTAASMAKTRQIAAVFEFAHSRRQARLTRDMHRLAHQQDTVGLTGLFDSGRNRRLLDINTPNALGDAPLHIACKHDNLEMAELCLRLGADPFLKSRGRLPFELTHAEGIRTMLREAPMVPPPRPVLSPSARLEGYLSKWTNYAEGYKRRWFVLEDRFLAYYKSQAEYPMSCRGSVNVLLCAVQEHTADKLRFEVSIGANRFEGEDNGGKKRFHLRADSVVDAKRWVIAIEEAKQSIFTTSTGSVMEGCGRSASDLSVMSHGIGARGDMGDLISNLSLLLQDNNAENDGQAREVLEQLRAENERREAEMDRLKRRLAVLESIGRPNSLYRQSQSYEGVKRSGSTVAPSISDDETIPERSESEVESYNDTHACNDIHACDRLEDDLFFDAVDEGLNKYPAHPEMSIVQESNIESFQKQRRTLDNRSMTVPLNSRSINGNGNDPVPSACASSSQAAKGPLLALRPRTRMPADATTMPPINLWSIIKGMIGKDIFRIPVPINFSEPLSMLQRLAEDCQYANELLGRAAEEEDVEKRMLWVAAFAVSCYGSTEQRLKKPFNPLLGETYELIYDCCGHGPAGDEHEVHWDVRKGEQDVDHAHDASTLQSDRSCPRDHGFYYLAEQVSHHPPISACHCHSPAAGWAYWSEVRVSNRFSGKSLDITPEGLCHVRLDRWGEHYVWRKPQMTIYNLIVGRLWIDHYGAMSITKECLSEPTSELKCELEFKEHGWRGANAKRVIGRVVQADRVMYDIGGHWNDQLTATHTHTGSTISLWKRRHCQTEIPANYHFTPFALGLNQTSPELEQWLCPSDARFRPDQRAMEEGRWEEANQLKALLEEKQRTAKRNGMEAKPRWFEERDILCADCARDVGRRGEDCKECRKEWRYRGGYWEAREAKDWIDVPDLYLP